MMKCWIFLLDDCDDFKIIELNFEKIYSIVVIDDFFNVNYLY